MEFASLANMVCTEPRRNGITVIVVNKVNISMIEEPQNVRIVDQGQSRGFILLDIVHHVVRATLNLTKDRQDVLHAHLAITKAI